MWRNPESEIKVKDLVVLVLWMREDNTVFEEGGLGLWWKERWRRAEWPWTAGTALRPSEGFFVVHDGVE